MVLLSLSIFFGGGPLFIILIADVLRAFWLSEHSSSAVTYCHSALITLIGSVTSLALASALPLSFLPLICLKNHLFFYTFGPLPFKFPLSQFHSCSWYHFHYSWVGVKVLLCPAFFFPFNISFLVVLFWEFFSPFCLLFGIPFFLYSAWCYYTSRNDRAAQLEVRVLPTYSSLFLFSQQF